MVEEDGFLKKIGKGFWRNTEDVLDGILSFIIFMITAIPYFIVLGIIAGVVCVVVRIFKKRKAKKTDKKGDSELKDQVK